MKVYTWPFEVKRQLIFDFCELLYQMLKAEFRKAMEFHENQKGFKHISISLTRNSG